MKTDGLHHHKHYQIGAMCCRMIFGQNFFPVSFRTHTRAFTCVTTVQQKLLNQSEVSLTFQLTTQTTEFEF